MLGGVHDSSDVSFPGGSSSSSANAFAMLVGGGIDFRVTPSFSFGPSIDYVPTFFAGGDGNDRQDNWRFGLHCSYSFGPQTETHTHVNDRYILDGNRYPAPQPTDFVGD